MNESGLYRWVESACSEIRLDVHVSWYNGGAARNLPLHWLEDHVDMQRGLEANSLFLHMSCAGLEGELDEGRNSRCDRPCRWRRKGRIKVVRWRKRGGDADVLDFKSHLKDSDVKVGRPEERMTSLTSRVRLKRIWSVAFARRSRCPNSTCAHGGKHTSMVPHVHCYPSQKIQLEEWTWNAPSYSQRIFRGTEKTWHEIFYSLRVFSFCLNPSLYSAGMIQVICMVRLRLDEVCSEATR